MDVWAVGWSSDSANHRFRWCVFYSFGPGLGKHGRRRNSGLKHWLGPASFAADCPGSGEGAAFELGKFDDYGLWFCGETF